MEDFPKAVGLWSIDPRAGSLVKYVDKIGLLQGLMVKEYLMAIGLWRREGCEQDRAVAGSDGHGELRGNRACEHQPLGRVHGGLPQGDLFEGHGFGGGSFSEHREVPQQLDIGEHSDPRGGGCGGGQRDRDEENLKAVPIVLPVLGPPSGTQSSIEAGDWLAQIRPYIADVASSAGVWWDRAVGLVSQRYAQWLGASAIDRLKIEPPSSLEIADGKVRLEQRITTLLLSQRFLK